MKIFLKAVAAVPNTEIDTPPTVFEDILTYRGVEYDLSQLPDGGEVQATSPFVDLIKRVNGRIELKLEYRYDSTRAEADQSSDIADYTFDIEYGSLPDPIKYKPVVEVIEEPQEIINE